uniref:Uncharacterized protein n=1 Tax=Oryza glumipatula TaxID=40148 RepID=A0A0E0BRI4_9ORYZ
MLLDPDLLAAFCGAVDTYAWVLEEAKHHNDDDVVVGLGLRPTSASARTPWETVPAGTSSALLGLDAALPHSCRRSYSWMTDIRAANEVVMRHRYRREHREEGNENRLY